MGQFAKIRIQVDGGETPDVGDLFSFEFYNEVTASPSFAQIVFSDTLQEPTGGGGYYVLIGTTGSERADNIKQAVIAMIGNADFTYSIVPEPNDFDRYYLYVEASTYDYSYAQELVNSTHSTVVMVVTARILPLIITSVTPEAAAVNPWTHIRHRIVVENAVYPIDLWPTFLGGNKICDSEADLWLEYPRFIYQPQNERFFYAQKDGDRSNNAPYSNVDTWDIPAVTVAEGPASATVTVNYYFAEIGEVHVSLQFGIESWNGSAWVNYAGPQSSQTFLDVPAGSYRGYILDNFNGFNTREFTVIASSEVGIPDPFFKIETANSLKYYNANEGLFDNALFTQQAYHNVQMQCYAQKLRKSDILTTQIKSTYRSIETVFTDIDNKVIGGATATLKVQNTMLRDKRDVNLYRGDGGQKTYITFDGGNQYDPVSGANIGQYYMPNGALPSFAKTGMYVTIPAGQFVVESILYWQSKGRWVLVVAPSLPTAGPTPATCESLYDNEPFDIYEFPANLSSAPEGIYKIAVNATDTRPNYADVSWYSEPINLMQSHSEVVVIDYSHSSNIEQMDYSTGLVNRLVVPARFIKWRPKIESARLTTDLNDTKILKSVQRRTSILEVVMVPQYLAEKISIATGHNNVKIDGKSCVLVEDGEIDDNIDNQNPFYNMTLSMQIGDSVTITDSMGVVSESAAVLGGTTTQIIGI